MEPVPRAPEQIPDGYDKDDIDTFFYFAQLVHRLVFEIPLLDFQNNLPIYENSSVSKRYPQSNKGLIYINGKSPYFEYNITYDQTLTGKEITKHKNNIQIGKPYPMKIHRFLQVKMGQNKQFLIEDKIIWIEYSDGDSRWSPNNDHDLVFEFDKLSNTITQNIDMPSRAKDHQNILSNLFKLWMRIRKELKKKEEFQREFDAISQDYLNEAYALAAFYKHKAYFLKKDDAKRPSDYVKIAGHDALPLKRKLDYDMPRLPLSSPLSRQSHMSDDSAARTVFGDKDLVEMMWKLGIRASNESIKKKLWP